MIDNFMDLIYLYVPRLLALFICLPIHEFAHAFAASRLGDPTPRYQGRLTLNPLAHLDMFGSVCLVFGGFGWAKPVPVNPFNLRDKKGGMALVALAGPISNLALMLVSALVAKILLMLSGASPWILFFYYIFAYLAFINLCHVVFNLLPVPPLDGSKVLYYFLPRRIVFKIQQNEHIIYIVFMAMIILENVGVLRYGIGTLLNFIIAPVWGGVCLLFGL